jgi:hypothetical protein
MPTNAHPLPLTVAALDFIPVDHQKQYSQRMDGSFGLDWITSDDMTSYMAHVDEVSGGRLGVLSPGDTPGSIAARRSTSEAMSADVLQMAKKFEDQQREDRRRALTPAYEKELAQLKAKFAQQVNGESPLNDPQVDDAA